MTQDEGRAHGSERWYWIAAVVVALAAGAAMSFRASDAIQGFHSFNEGFYLANGARDAARGFFAPVFAPLDPNNPFIYPVVLATALKLLGVTTGAARAVSIVASMASVVLTFALAKQLYNARIGLIAAVFFALTPGEMLVGRNIQTDALMLAFIVGASFAFVRAVATQSKGWSVAAGVLLGMGVLTKLPAVLLIPGFAVWELWRSRGFSWLRKTSTWMTAAAFALVVLPWYAYRYLASPAFRGAQSYLIGTARTLDFGYLWEAVFSEIGWMFSPVVTVVILASFVFMATKRQAADKFVISVFGTYLAVFLFYNYHAYYYLPLIPFGAIAAARGIAAAARWLTRALPSGSNRRGAAVLVVLAGAVAIVLAGFSVATLAAKKLQGVPTDQYVPLLVEAGYDPTKLVLGIDQEINGAEGPPVTFYAEQAGARVIPYPLPAGTVVPQGHKLVAMRVSTPGSAEGERLVAYPAASILAPLVLGRAFIFTDGSASFFKLNKPITIPAGPWWLLGFYRVPGVLNDQHALYEVPQ